MQTNTILQEKPFILSVLAVMQETFGQKLKVWRKVAGMTQAELATAAGIKPAYMSNLERDVSPNKKSGKPKPSEKLVERFARVLRVDLDEIRLAAGYAPLEAINNKIYPVREGMAVVFSSNVDLSEDEQRELVEEFDAFLHGREYIKKKRAEELEIVYNEDYEQEKPFPENAREVPLGTRKKVRA